MAKKRKQEEPEEKECSIEFPYTVQSLADRLEIEPASVRVKLRNADIPKAGKMYGWKTKREFEEIVKELEATPATPIRKEAAPAPASSRRKKEPEPEPKKTTLRRRSRPAAEATA